MNAAMQDQRKHRRFAFDARCYLRSFGGIRRQVRAVDISMSGLRVEAMRRLPLGATISIEIGDFRNLPAQIAWSTASFTGIQFATPLHPAIFDQITCYELSDYDQDHLRLSSLAERASIESFGCDDVLCSERVRELGADLYKAAVISRSVQRLRAHESFRP